MNRLLATLLACLSLHAAAHAQEPKLTTLKFQEFQENGVPKGWVDDTSWAEVEVEYGSDRISEEQQVAKLTLKNVKRGQAQIRGPRVPVKVGAVYTVRLRVKSTPAMPVMLSIRENKAPWKEYSLRQTAQATENWSSPAFTFEGTKDVADHQLIIAFKQPGTVWLDSIQILEESREQFTERSAGSTRAGNLLPNGAFRVGTFGWDTYALVDRREQYPLHSGKQYSLDAPALSVGTVEGRPAGLLELTTYHSVLVSSMFTAEPGADYTCVATVRRQQGSGPVKLRLFSPSWEKAPVNTQEVGTGWKQISLQGRVPVESGIQLRTELTASGEGQLEIGEIRFVQRAEERNAPPSPEFGVVADRRMTAYELGETPQVTLLAQGVGAATTQKVQWQLVSATGETVRQGEWTVQNGEQAAEFAELPVGWYQVRWVAEWAPNAARGELNLAVVPEVDRKDGAASPWGIHVEGNAHGVRKMQLLGVHWLRTNNPLWTKWTAVQPERETWVFPDEHVEKFVSAGLGIIGNLDRTPKWAAHTPEDDRPGTDYHGFKADLPNDWPAWEEYVRRMVRRYRGKITYWEVWNEPDITFLNPPKGMTNAEAYLQLLEHSAPIIKAENPEAEIIMSPAYVLKKRSNPQGYQPDFTERLIEAGGLKHVDIFAYHHYLQPSERLFDRPERYVAQLGAVRDAMQAAGKPPVIWNSEWGIIDFTLPTHQVHLPGNSGISSNLAAQEMVAWSVAQLAAGVEKLFWYDGMDNFYYHFHVTRDLFDYGQPRPIFVAYAVLTKALDGLRYSEAGSEVLENGRVVNFTGTGRQVKVAYPNPGQSLKVPVPAGAKVTDYLGQPVKPLADGTVTLEGGPIYVETSL